MKNLPWYIAGLLAVGLAIVLLKDCSGPAPEIGYIRDSVQYWKNREGRAVASLKQREADFAVEKKGFLDSIAKLHNTKPGRIKEVTRVIVRGDATIPGAVSSQIVYRDTGSTRYVESMTQLFLSPYYTVNATLRSDFDSSTVSVVSYDTLSLVMKEVREGNLFNRRTYWQLDGTNANPHNVITGLKSYRVPAARPKKWGLGFQVGITLDGTGQPKPYGGFGISYNVIRL